MKVRHLYISPGHNYFGHHGNAPGEHLVTEVTEIQCLAGRGIPGDRFFDYKKDYKGQITFFSQDVFDAMCEQLNLSGKSPGASRRNVIVSGLDLTTLIGRQFEVQGIRFEGTAHCAPCHWMDHAFGPGAEHFLQGRGGLRVKILSDGTLRVDADFKKSIETTDNHGWTRITEPVS